MPMLKATCRIVAPWPHLHTMEVVAECRGFVQQDWCENFRRNAEPVGLIGGD